MIQPQSAGFTDKQGQYLAFIYAYTCITGQAPAEADLQRFFAVTAPSVHQMIPTFGTQHRTAHRARTTPNTAQSELGLRYQPTVEGQRLMGTYRRSMSLVSGRVALLETERGFALVPWRPVLEKRIGQVVSGVVRGGAVSWEFGRRQEIGR